VFPTRVLDFYEWNRRREKDRRGKNRRTPKTRTHTTRNVYYVTTADGRTMKTYETLSSVSSSTSFNVSTRTARQQSSAIFIVVSDPTRCDTDRRTLAVRNKPESLRCFLFATFRDTDNHAPLVVRFTRVRW
jgi:hypothetical protein